jgi:hypothetical protein
VRAEVRSLAPCAVDRALISPFPIPRSPRAERAISDDNVTHTPKRSAPIKCSTTGIAIREPSIPRPPFAAVIAPLNAARRLRRDGRLWAPDLARFNALKKMPPRKKERRMSIGDVWPVLVK